jgi:cytochrome c oxidase subunit 4
MSHRAISVRTYVTVFVGLMVLTAITIFSAHVDLGRGNVVVALAIAFTKAALVVTYFMHLRFGARMSRAVLVAGILAVALMLGFTLDDVLTRSTTTYLPFVGALDGVRPPGAPVPPHPPME